MVMMTTFGHTADDPRLLRQKRANENANAANDAAR